MGERTSYAPGTFSWVELGTTDAGGAKRFYSELFGWLPEDMPAGEGTYTMLKLDRKDVGALYELSDQQRSGGAHPAWLSYATVDDVDAATAKAGELGGTVVNGPVDVFDAGRMSLLRDPQGAFFALWQPGRHIGAGVVNDPGSLTWNELATNDVPAATRFYSELFGWSAEAMDTGGGPPYTIVRVGDRTNGGITALRREGVPPHWLVYFTTADTDATVARVEELGGRTVVPAMDVPQGRIAVVLDPQGAAFALFQGEVDD
jgi:predicted enzyme related to lactoylglutathione lyase